jgi:hypothetical protein
VTVVAAVELPELVDGAAADDDAAAELEAAVPSVAVVPVPLVTGAMAEDSPPSADAVDDVEVW